MSTLVTPVRPQALWFIDTLAWVHVTGEETDGRFLRVTVTDHGSGMKPRIDSPGIGMGLPIIARISDLYEVRTPATGGTAGTQRAIAIMTGRSINGNTRPSATLADIQSGLGCVHNTFMLEGIDKTVVRGPLVVKPKPAWFYDNAKMHRLGEKLVPFEGAPSWLKLPSVVSTALGG